MAEYRVFFIGPDGHIKSAEEMNCPSDQVACAQAISIVRDWPAREVWCGDRKVAAIPTAGTSLAGAITASLVV